MAITLNMRNGRSHHLKVNPWDTVGSLKQFIQNRMGVPVQEQRLVFVNGPLNDDSKLLSWYGLQSGSQLSLLIIPLPPFQVAQPPSFQVFIRNERGQLTTYDITPEETVDHFKVRVEQREGVPVSRQRLLHQSIEMTTGRLTDYNVTNHSTIDLMLRLRLIMEITLTMLNGASHRLTVNPEDTVGSLKQLIQSKLGVPVQEQKLVLVNGQRTHLNDDSKPLSWYGLQSGSQVSLLGTPLPFQVFLGKEKGEPSTYDITHEETGDYLKARVEQREGVPVSQQRLFHQSREITTGRLTDYNVTNYSTIDPMLRLRLSMNITITMLNGTAHRLMVNREDTVGSLKRLIQSKLGVPVQEQRLVFVNGQRTPLSDDSKPLSWYGLQSGSQVSLLGTPLPFQVFLGKEKSEPSTYDITHEETVDHFKARVEQREGVPVSQQRLLHQSREMTTGRLTDYNVTNQSTIHLRLTMDITLTMLNGASHHLTVNPENTVGSLKQLIQSKLGVPVQEQKLVIVNGQRTHLNDDSKPLSWYGLQSGSQVSLLGTPLPFQVFLGKEKGEPSTYDITHEETGDYFKARVEQREGVPVSQQRLLHQSREITTGRLTDYNVTNYSTIDPMLRLRLSMNITITMLNGTAHRLMVNREDTVGSLKRLIQSKLGVPVQEQRLVFVNGQRTHLSDDSKPLSWYGLQSGSQVSLLDTPLPFQIFLGKEKGEPSTYDITPEETVDHFKARVEQREGVPVSQQRLLHQSREMTTGRLTDYNVANQSTIHLRLTMDITLTMLNGASHRLTVNQQDTVGSLKRLIQNKLGVPVQEQKLVFVHGEKKTLNDDSKPLSWYGLQSGSQVSLLITPPPFQVFLSKEKSEPSTYDITPDETVDQFKARVEQREGVPVDQQMLLHQSREMTTGRLTDYNVTNESNIDLILYIDLK